MGYWYEQVNLLRGGFMILKKSLCVSYLVTCALAILASQAALCVEVASLEASPALNDMHLLQQFF